VNEQEQWRRIVAGDAQAFSCVNGLRLSSIRLLFIGRCSSDRPLRLVIFGDPFALNVRLRTEVSAHYGAPFLWRCSTNRTFEFQRGIIPGHASLLPLFDQR
jgi:hypothetical protein